MNALALLVALVHGAGAQNLKLDWKDCGAAHGKVTGLTPSSMPLGSTTTATGSGTVDEDVADGTFEVDVKAGIISKTFSGDLCVAKTIELPLGTGSVKWDGLKCPVAKGAVSVSMDIQLSSEIPSQLLNTELTVKGTAKNGDQLLCMSINTSPETIDVHPERSAMIKEIQNTPGVLWTASAHPRFASEAPGASKVLCGVKGDQKARVDDLVKQGEIKESSFAAKDDIPDHFDSAENWPQCAKIIGDIRDQSACGCCWAFAGAEAASDRMCIATNASIMIPLSAQDVCFNGGGMMSSGCNGGQIDAPWSYIKKGGLFGGKGAVSGGQYQGSGPFGKGMCSDFSLPHCHHHGPQGKDPYPAEGKPGCPNAHSPPKFSKCDTDAKAPHDDFEADKYSYDGETVTARGVEGIQRAIMAGGPMEVAFTVYEDFENYAGGIYHHVTGGQVGGHAVKVVGWGTDSDVKYWKIANSWNPYWGEDGYFRIKFGEGGIDEQAVGSDPAAKWSRAGKSVEVVV